MRLKYLIFIALSAVFFQACQESWPTDLAGKKALLEKTIGQKADLDANIVKLESEIAKLDTTKKTEKKVLVKVDTLKPKTFKHFVKVQGTIESKGNVSVSPKMAGVVTRVFVTEGQNVAKGQILAELDASLVKSGMAELETAMEMANIAFDKQKRLWDQQIGTEMQFLQAKNQKESLEKRMLTTQEQLDMTRVYAPISGTIDKVNVKVGEGAMPGVPGGLFQIVNQSEIHFASNLSESYVGKIKKGDKVAIFIPTLNKKFDSKVTVMGESIHPFNRTIAMEASLPRGTANLKSNMSGEVVVNDKTVENALTVPLNLIQNTELGSFVFVARKASNGVWKAHRARISTGMSYNGRIVVEEGLKPGDLLVTTGNQDLAEGQSVSF